jgi:hypothetical protein
MSAGNQTKTVFSAQPTPCRRHGGQPILFVMCTSATNSKIKTSTCTADQYLYKGFLVFWSAPLRQETSSPEVQQSTCRVLVCCSAR